jgi:hypothetical protein
MPRDETGLIVIYRLASTNNMQTEQLLVHEKNLCRLHHCIGVALPQILLLVPLANTTLRLQQLYSAVPPESLTDAAFNWIQNCWSRISLALLLIALAPGLNESKIF